LDYGFRLFKTKAFTGKIISTEAQQRHLKIIRYHIFTRSCKVRNQSDTEQDKSVTKRNLKKDVVWKNSFLLIKQRQQIHSMNYNYRNKKDKSSMMQINEKNDLTLKSELIICKSTDRLVDL
jgi:tRNA G10  N-methylase Trm11